MSETIRLSRAFQLEDATMIQFARNTKINLETNLASFAAFDTDFTPAFIANYVLQINTAEGLSSDNQLIDVQAQASMDLEDKMDECRNNYQHMKYFIEKAFPGKKGTWIEFGYKDYHKARRKAVHLIQFLHDLHQVAIKYSVELAAVAFEQQQIDHIETLMLQLRNQKSIQDQSRGIRSTAANNRVIALNAVWKTTQRICRAGKITFHKDYGRYQLFLLPTNRGKTVSEEEE